MPARKKRKARKFRETDHMCRFCDGPVMALINAGPSGGGNAYYECIVCGQGCSSLTSQHICYCGKTEEDGSQIHRCFRRSEVDTHPDALKGWTEVKVIHRLGVLKRCRHAE